jgi:PEP-CTERM motif
VELNKFKRGIGVLAGSILVVGLGVVPAFGDGIPYNDIPASDVNGGPETTSYSGAANGTGNSFGSVISPTATASFNNVDLMMSNYATTAMYSSDPSASGSGYNVNMQLDIYAITGPGTSVADSANGITSQIYTQGTDTTLAYTTDQSFTIGWRPAAASSAIPGGCGIGNSNAYLVSANVYSCGQLNELDFNLGGILTQGTSYLWVATILNSSDPAAQSLNWAINNLSDPTSISLTSNPQIDSNYTGTNGAVTGGIGWASIGQGEISFTPEPATFGLIGLGLLGIGFSVRGKSKKG